jgi:hypothetical protein
MAIANRLSLRSVFHIRRFNNALIFVFPTVCGGWTKRISIPGRADYQIQFGLLRERDRRPWIGKSVFEEIL